MEDNFYSSEFSSQLEHTTEPMHMDWHITARWANFLAIVNYVVLGLITILMIFVAVFERNTEDLGLFPFNSSGLFLGGMFLFLILFLVINTFLYRFAQRLKMALNANSQEDFETAWLNFRNYFRWNGIFVIVFFLFYIAIIVEMIVTINEARPFL